MKRIAPIILSSVILAAACTQNPKPNALANGDASLKPQVRQPAERDLLVVFTPQPSYAEIVVQSQGRSRLIVAEGEGGGAAAGHQGELRERAAPAMRMGTNADGRSRRERHDRLPQGTPVQPIVEPRNRGLAAGKAASVRDRDYKLRSDYGRRARTRRRDRARSRSA